MSISDILVVFFLIAFLLLASYFLVDVRYTDRTLLLNLSKGVSAAESLINSTNTTIKKSNLSTYISQLQAVSKDRVGLDIMFYKTDGYPVSVVRHVSGNFLVNCGRNISVLNRMFIDNITSLKAAFITGNDEDHLGNCARAFLIMTPSFVDDSTGNVNGVYYDNYVSVVGDRIKDLQAGSFSGGKGVLDLTYRYYGPLLTMTYGNFTIAWADSCDGACLKQIPRNGLVWVLVMQNASSLVVDDILSINPSLLVSDSVSEEVLAAADAHDISVSKLVGRGDFAIRTDGSSLQVGGF